MSKEKNRPQDLQTAWLCITHWWEDLRRGGKCPKSFGFALYSRLLLLYLTRLVVAFPFPVPVVVAALGRGVVQAALRGGPRFSRKRKRGEEKWKLANSKPALEDRKSNPKRMAFKFVCERFEGQLKTCVNANPYYYVQTRYVLRICPHA